MNHHQQCDTLGPCLPPAAQRVQLNQLVSFFVTFSDLSLDLHLKLRLLVYFSISRRIAMLILTQSRLSKQKYKSNRAVDTKLGIEGFFVCLLASYNIIVWSVGNYTEKCVKCPLQIWKIYIPLLIDLLISNNFSSMTFFYATRILRVIGCCLYDSQRIFYWFFDIIKKTRKMKIY